MRKKYLLVALSILMAFVASALFYGQLKAYRSNLDNIRRQLVEVPVTTRSVNAFEVLVSDDIRTVKVLESSYPASEFVGPAAVVGCMTTQPVPAGDVLLRSKVALDKSRLGLAFAIPDGKVAMSVPVDEIASVSGHIRAGDKVDVVHVERGQDGQLNMMTGRVLLSSVRVLSIGVKTERQMDGASAKTPLPHSIVLELTPEQAPILAWGEKAGEVLLALMPAGESAAHAPAAYSGPKDAPRRTAQPAASGSEPSSGSSAAAGAMGGKAQKKQPTGGWKVDIIVPGKESAVYVPGK
jgi:pilus assembly protein CpaB